MGSVYLRGGDSDRKPVVEQQCHRVYSTTIVSVSIGCQDELCSYSPGTFSGQIDTV